MWCTWNKLLLVSCALVTAAVTAESAAETTAYPTTDLLPEKTDDTPATTERGDSTTTEARLGVATTRAPLRTLDRQAAELAWRTWLQSAESGNQNAPPRRITTKSLFITPLVCPKGQRLDQNGCVQVWTVDKDEHERILLEQLNALFSSPATGDVMYDYDGEPGPLQLSIPISLEPQAAPLLNQDPSAQAQELQANTVKKDETNDASIEAELELLKLQHSQNNYTGGTGVLNHDVMSTFQQYGDKPKRDSADISVTSNNTDIGQKELVYGHVNVDPVLYHIEHMNTAEKTGSPIDLKVQNNDSVLNSANNVILNTTDANLKKTDTKLTETPTKEGLNKVNDPNKLNPENDYSDIGEAIKLISRYAEVSTDNNFNKDLKKQAANEDSILGTRTKQQYRRNKPKLENSKDTSVSSDGSLKQTYLNKELPSSFYPNIEPYYRYSWPSQYPHSPPANYPFKHIQDYWPGKHHIGGVYNSHGNPRRHHHSYPHYMKPHGYYPEPYPALKEYGHKVVQRHAKPAQPQTNNNQNLYSLLGLRHWFSSDGVSKR